MTAARQHRQRPDAQSVGCRLVVCSNGQVNVGNLGGDDFFHLPDAGKVGVDVPLSLLVENLLAVQEHFHDALAARGDSDCGVRAVGPEKLVRHPRGGSVVLSRHAVGNLQLNFAFHDFSSQGNFWLSPSALYHKVRRFPNGPTATLLTRLAGRPKIAQPAELRAGFCVALGFAGRCIVADLNNDEVLALAKASGINMPDDLLPEVRESLNGLLEALDAITEPDVAGIEALPIIVSETARKQEA